MAESASYEQALARAKAKKKSLILAARTDPVAFMEYVMRDTNPATYGQRIKCQPFHKDWQYHMESNPFWLIEAPVGHGKTSSVASRILWRMGRFPERRVAVAGAVADKVLKEVRQYIERSVELREVFPNLLPSDDPADPWTDSQITIKRPFVSKDPSLQVCGELGNLLGSRIDDLYLDDILNQDNTNTEYSRKKMITWIDSTCMSRMTPQIGCVGLIGTPWHKEDAIAELAKRPGFAVYRCSAVENPDDAPEKWRPIWPSVWSLDALMQVKENTSDADFQRTRLCRVRLDATSRFKEGWILRCAMGGRGLRMLSAAPRTQGGRVLQCFTGVDLAAGKKAQNARTSIFTSALLDDGRARPVHIDVGLFTGPETIDKLRLVHRMFGGKIYVESNAAQVYITQFAQLAGYGDDALDVHAFYTGNNKWDSRYGVESLAVEFRNGMWCLPCEKDGDFTTLEGIRWASPGVAAFVSQALYFDPSQHTGDVLMSAWLCREALRAYAGDRVQHVNLLAR